MGLPVVKVQQESQIVIVLLAHMVLVNQDAHNAHLIVFLFQAVIISFTTVSVIQTIMGLMEIVSLVDLMGHRVQAVKVLVSVSFNAQRICIIVHLQVRV